MNPLPLLAESGLHLSWWMVAGLILGAVGLAARLAPAPTWRKLGSGAALIGILLIGVALPLLGEWLPQTLFWLLAATAVACAGIAITSRSPVYTAIWFAMSLLGTAGLFLLQGAYFLGVATIVVYAGAIIVTFLFVLMLAQPEGHSAYDRVSWAGFVPLVAAIACALLVGVVASALPILPGSVSPDEILHDDHVAKLGTELFARHLVAVEIAGTLLLVALVGAVAIVIQGRPRRRAPAHVTGEDA